MFNHRLILDTEYSQASLFLRSLYYSKTQFESLFLQVPPCQQNIFFCDQNMAGSRSWWPNWNESWCQYDRNWLLLAAQFWSLTSSPSHILVIDIYSQPNPGSGPYFHMWEAPIFKLLNLDSFPSPKDVIENSKGRILSGMNFWKPVSLSVRRFEGNMVLWHTGHKFDFVKM